MFMTYLMPAALFIFALSGVYFILIFPRERDERSNLILKHAFQNAYYVMLAALLVTFVLSKLFEVVDEHFQEAVLVDVLAAHLTVMLTAIILNRKM
ncbi:hypothetical protein DUZ99_10265 [Xylanibacillus composti]|uniref:Uncharacterized protein n=1 Tax=Xylanibacillus composti TaxID=1572762 RepID=A0A8J4H1C1_9BACL|nr:hypothetical protein [Xylanibacillus composti]MDT9725356.1 hypothetical protein [Xylanibacillus composti]GIQ69118.1 hypothetical protein XYCOK13_19420 [Xylanibacillus composti]